MTWHGGNNYLTLEQMQDNATYIWLKVQPLGWTMNAVAGMLGNMQTESNINPQIWEGLNEGNLSGGYGLTQWTPATKYINWCIDRGLSYPQMDSNIARIQYEVENNEQWFYNSQLELSPPYTFYEYVISEEDPYLLAMYFLWFYEHPAESIQPDRGVQAEYWFEFLGGVVPPKPKRKKLPLYYYLKKF